MAGMACLQANLADEDAGEGGKGKLASRPALLCSSRTINPSGYRSLTVSVSKAKCSEGSFWNF